MLVAREAEIGRGAVDRVSPPPGAITMEKRSWFLAARFGQTPALTIRIMPFKRRPTPRTLAFKIQ